MASCGRLVIGLPMLVAGGLPTRRKKPSCATERRQSHFYVAHPRLAISAAMCGRRWSAGAPYIWRSYCFGWADVSTLIGDELEPGVCEGFPARMAEGVGTPLMRRLLSRRFET